MFAGDRLHVSDWARERARQIVLSPPVPWAARPLVEATNFVTVALLRADPGQYGFAPLPPVSLRKPLVAGGARYVKRGVLPFLPDRLRLNAAPRQAASG